MRVEFCVRPSKPFDHWLTELQVMGYRSVGLDIDAEAALDFQREGGSGILCFIRRPGGAVGDLPAVDCCSLEEALKRRKPPTLLTVGMADRADDVDSFLARHPNRIEALEVSATEVRMAYEGDARATFEWTSRLARVGGRRSLPVITSSFATHPEEILSPLAKEAFAKMTKSRGGPLGLSERRFARRLEGEIVTRKKGGEL
jgi:hypothetical protein